MGYADGFYYGQGKIIVHTLTDEHVKVIGKSTTYEKDSDSNLAIFRVPCGESYLVEIFNNNKLQDTYTADMGYGDVIEITQEIHPAIVTIWSAANDTVFYYEGDQTVTLCTTDATGKAEDIVMIPGQTLELYSSVAKDTSNDNVAYHKTVNITENTEEIKLMPDSTLYWYGYGADNWSASGYTIWGGAVGGVTKNTNNMYLLGTGNNTSKGEYPGGVGLVNKFTSDGTKTLYVKNNQSFNGWFYYNAGSTKALNDGKAISSGPAAKQDCGKPSGSNWFGFGIYHTGNLTVYAVYLE